MQPYLFPYIGYFQLINCVDLFVLLDDVNYIMRGYINRNTLMINGKKYSVKATDFCPITDGIACP